MYEDELDVRVCVVSNGTMRRAVSSRHRHRPAHRVRRGLYDAAGAGLPPARRVLVSSGSSGTKLSLPCPRRVSVVPVLCVKLQSELCAPRHKVTWRRIMALGI